MLRGTAMVTAVAVMLVALHVEFNYPPELHAVVRPKALGVATVVTFFFSFILLQQLRRLTLMSDELRRLVDRDRLTDVATREFFFKHMGDAPRAFGISLMIDIDRFKAINDTYGHLAGDQVIASVARTIARNVREEDIVCRFGGEEFIVFLSGHTIESGYQIAERMRQAIARDAIQTNGWPLRATVSIGGSLKDRLTDIEEAIHEADAALYRAKAAGRNKTVFSAATAGAPPVRMVAAD